MQPIEFKEVNIELGEPPNWDEATMGKCKILPVLSTGSEFRSLWALTWKERYLILFGANVMVRVVTNAHPPIALSINTTLTKGKANDS